jgi:menaquinone-dependent protoporphyrinogen oxidase
MKVLVCAASRYGATADIAARIFSVLDLALDGAEVHLCAPEAVTDIDGYDAVVLGSAVYMGRWLESARALVATNATVLAERPVWLFSSGPIGRPAKPDKDPAAVAEMMTAIGAREHRLFAGRLARNGLRLRDRAVMAAVRAPDGDYRDWADIEAWAGGIATALRAMAPTATR